MKLTKARVALLVLFITIVGAIASSSRDGLWIWHQVQYSERIANPKGLFRKIYTIRSKSVSWIWSSKSAPPLSQEEWIIDCLDVKWENSMPFIGYIDISPKGNEVELNADPIPPPPPKWVLNDALYTGEPVQIKKTVSFLKADIYFRR